MKFLGLIGSIIIDKSHTVAARAVIVIFRHVHGVTAHRHRAGRIVERMSFGIGATSQEGQGGRFSERSGMDLE